jgi:glycosyltransferase involved in cell wall biosynthesis
MRVLLVANYEPDRQESMRRYADWLERVLQARGHEVDVAAPRAFFSRLASGPGFKKYLGYLDKFVLFPPYLRRQALTYDLVHVVDHSNSMYLRTVCQKPHLITCHDVLAIRAARCEFSQVSIGWSGRILQNWILSGLRQAPHVLCVSAKTANDLKVLIGDTGKTDTKTHQLLVVPNALNWTFSPEVPLASGVISRLGLKAGDPYFLHVGGNQWYKNREGVLRIFARLVERSAFSDAKLIMAGKPWTAVMRDVLRNERVADRVVEAVEVSNEELQALYGNALALLFPSHEEGFGLPIIEAQASGCPVITTRRPPMSEVAGEGAIFVDPGDPQAAAEAIDLGLENRERLRAAGFRNLERFDERAIADQYCALYEAITSSDIASAPNLEVVN